MNTEIKCSNCKKDLEIKYIHTTMDGLYNITIEVTPCNNIDCYDCGKCEVSDLAEKENKELKNEIQKLTVKIESAQDELKI